MGSMKPFGTTPTRITAKDDRGRDVVFVAVVEVEERLRALFEREIAEAEYDYEPSAFVGWLRRLRDEAIAEAVGAR